MTTLETVLEAFVDHPAAVALFSLIFFALCLWGQRQYFWWKWNRDRPQRMANMNKDLNALISKATKSADGSDHA
jgi:hypothetical protein